MSALGGGAGRAGRGGAGCWACCAWALAAPAALLAPLLGKPANADARTYVACKKSRVLARPENTPHGRPPRCSIVYVRNLPFNISSEEVRIYSLPNSQISSSRSLSACMYGRGWPGLLPAPC